MSITGEVAEGSASAGVTTTSKSVEGVELAFKNLYFSVPDKKSGGKKHIVNNVEGFFEPGTLTAIMGSSGAGKTTFLNTMAGFNTAGFVTGSVLINGQQRDLKLFRKISCYIMQDDQLFSDATPRESIDFAAKLRRPELDPAGRTALVERILKMTGLDVCADVPVGNPNGDKGLSGGQKKRLSVAQELVTSPSIMFFDEPTSGLDSTTSFQVISLMKRLAQEGGTIIATIHQPSSELFQLFDKALFLSYGEIVYNGLVKDMPTYMDKELGKPLPPFTNPADFIVDIISKAQQEKSERQKLIDTWKKNAPVSDKLLPPISYPEYPKGGRYPSAGPRQFTLLYLRAVRSFIRNKKLSRARVGQHVGIGIVCGLLWLQMDNTQTYIQDRIALMFFEILVAMLFVLMPTVQSFPVERVIFELQHQNNWYGTLVYYLAKMAVDIPFEIFYSPVMGTIVYWMAGLQPEFVKYLMHLMFLLLVVWVVQAFATILSIRAPADVAISVAPMIIMPHILFCGFLVNLDNLPVFLSWLQWLSYVRYSFEGLLNVEFADLTLKCTSSEEVNGGPNPDNPNETLYVCPVTDGKQTLDRLGMNPDDYPRVVVDIVVLLGMSIILRVVGYILLKRKASRNKKGL